MCVSVFPHFVWIERGVNAAKDDERSAIASHPSDVIPAKGIASMDTDADHVAGAHRLGIEWIDGFIDDDGRTVSSGRRRGQHE